MSNELIIWFLIIVLLSIIIVLKIKNSKYSYQRKIKKSDNTNPWCSSINAVLQSCASGLKWVIKPFGLNRVDLQASPFVENRDRTYNYLLYLNADRMLYNFRAAAGLSTKRVLPLGGWERPKGNLRGHSTGHYLSALAQAFASSGDLRFKKKIDYLVTELGKCQDALSLKGYTPGFLSAYSETQFDKLEELVKYPKIWAPYYTLHKIIAGLIDCYELGGNTQALEIAKKIGDYVYTRLSKLPKEQQQKMWSLYIAGEYGGLNETIAELYALTGDEKFLTTAKYFDNDKLFDPCSNNQDQLYKVHANTHIPQIIGALRIFDQNNDPFYFNIAKNFWDMVVGHRTYNIGGTGEGEMFRESDKIAAYIIGNVCESCATYNMLKLTRNLFFHVPDPRYMDYYERALYNNILASQNTGSKYGGVTHYMPLSPGAHKLYSSRYHAFCCCHGTGMENHTKYQETIYSYSEDMATLYVNLFIPSVLYWPEKGFTISQITNYPAQESTTIIIDGSGQLNIKLRVPYWVQKGYNVKINGVEQDISANPGTYIIISRVWTNGDKIDISMPFSLRLERTPDDPGIGSIMYGPIVMVGKSRRKGFINLTLNTSDLTQSIKPADTALNFNTNGIALVPMYTAYNFRYHAYFKIA